MIEGDRVVYFDNGFAWLGLASFRLALRISSAEVTTAYFIILSRFDWLGLEAYEPL